MNRVNGHLKPAEEERLMIRSFACIVFGSILMVAASWWDNGQGDALGDGGLSAI